MKLSEIYSNIYNQEAGDRSVDKTAEFLDMSDVEKSMNLYMPEEYEHTTRNLMDAEKAKSLALRHPWLTGIPTLGIWPSIARGKAIDKIKREMLRKIPDLREQAYNRERDLSAIEAAKIRAAGERGHGFANSLGQAYLAAAIANSIGRNQEDK